MSYGRYFYDGPVTSFGVCISPRWRGTTYAVSEKKARNNLSYQYKKYNNHVALSRIELPGKIILEEG